MKTEQIFSPPRDVTDISDCYFYHLMDLPGHGVVGKEWDLRGGEDAYLGGVSFQGKRVLELGTASGYLCHYMEGKGAEVIGFDLSSEGSWDLVPFSGLDIPTYAVEMKRHIEKLKNGWWFAHRLFGSQAKAAYGNIYEIPDEIGPVDIATFGAILLHLRDPFRALHSALRLTREVAIVTEVHPEQPAGAGLGSVIHGGSSSGLRRFLRSILLKTGVVAPSARHPGCMYFLPDPQATHEGQAVTWWCFPPEVICRFLGVLGFEHQVITEHYQTFQGKRTRLYTIVGTRTRGSVGG
jgi:methyltransferase family protein